MVYLGIFLAGLASSLHCVGMCGGFALAIGAQRGNAGLRQVLYNLGRVNALTALGALSGGFGAALLAAAPFAIAERALALVAGTLMLIVGLEGLGFGRAVTASGSALARSTVGKMLGGVMRSKSLAAPLAVGVFNAFLPCQLIYGFAARAASTASALEGAATMLAFGLGTVPAMLVVGLAGDALTAKFRARVSRLAAVFVLAFALLTLGRGLGVDVHSWMGHGSHASHEGHGGHEGHGDHEGQEGQGGHEGHEGHADHEGQEGQEGHGGQEGHEGHADHEGRAGHGGQGGHGGHEGHGGLGDGS